MNNYGCIARLTKDPKLTERDDTTVCDMRVAINGLDGRTVYIDVAAFNGLGKACAKYLRKGSQVAISGALRYSEWESDSQKRSKHSVLAREVDFLDPKPQESGETE